MKTLEIKAEDHVFIIFDDLDFLHYVECKYCGIIRYSDFIEEYYKYKEDKIKLPCLSDEEKIIKDIIE